MATTTKWKVQGRAGTTQHSPKGHIGPCQKPIAPLTAQSHCWTWTALRPPLGQWSFTHLMYPCSHRIASHRHDWTNAADKGYLSYLPTYMYRIAQLSTTRVRYVYVFSLTVQAKKAFRSIFFFFFLLYSFALIVEQGSSLNTFSLLRGVGK